MTAPTPGRRRPPARQLLLSAAARVFARDGLAGATTRAISREAGVNEVTLFRTFGTKEHLITAVVGIIGFVAVRTGGAQAPVIIQSPASVSAPAHP